MSEHILPGNPPIVVLLRRSGRARRISLRVSRLDGRVTLTLPSGVRDREALDFAREKEAWVRSHLEARPDHVQVSHGVEVPFSGVLHRVVAGSGRSVRLENQTLVVPGAPERVAARLQGFLKHSARNRLAAASDHFSQRLGRPYEKLTLRDTRSRWGSCSSLGGLMYSWRLILCPPEVLNYVAAHEVAHLAEMNHSSAFWNTVTRIHGPYDAPRTWLRTNGSGLHSYRF